MFFIKMDLISTNPANKEKIELPSAIAPDVEIFTQEEAAEMLECLSKEPLMYQVLINLAIVTGCRRGELVALEWSDIDFSKATISISKSNYSIKGEGIHTKKPKTAGSRRILAIPPTCVKMLQTYRYEQALERLKLGDQWKGRTGFSPSGTVFRCIPQHQRCGSANFLSTMAFGTANSIHSGIPAQPCC